MKADKPVRKLLTTKVALMLMLMLTAGGEPEISHCGSTSGGGAVLEDGAVMLVGQAVVGGSSNAEHTAQFGAIACLSAQEAQPPDCPGDTDGNNVVDVLDILEILGSWGPCAGCPADLNGDNVVDIVDLLLALGSWGPCD